MSKKNVGKILLSSGIGTGIGILSASILIFLMAAALTIGDIPAMLISPLTVVLLALGSFFGGFSSAKLSEEKGLLCGAISGLLFFIITWFFGAVFENFGVGMAAAIKALMIVISASLGGIIGVNYIKK